MKRATIVQVKPRVILMGRVAMEIIEQAPWGGIEWRRVYERISKYKAGK